MYGWEGESKHYAMLNLLKLLRFMLALLLQYRSSYNFVALDGVLAMFSCPDTDRILDRVDEYLPISYFAGLC